MPTTTNPYNGLNWEQFLKAAGVDSSGHIKTDNTGAGWGQFNASQTLGDNSQFQGGESGGLALPEIAPYQAADPAWYAQHPEAQVYSYQAPGDGQQITSYFRGPNGSLGTHVSGGGNIWNAVGDIAKTIGAGALGGGLASGAFGDFLGAGSSLGGETGAFDTGGWTGTGIEGLDPAVVGTSTGGAGAGADAFADSSYMGGAESAGGSSATPGADAFADSSYMGPGNDVLTPDLLKDSGYQMPDANAPDISKLGVDSTSALAQDGGLTQAGKAAADGLTLKNITDAAKAAAAVKNLVTGGNATDGGGNTGVGTNLNTTMGGLSQSITPTHVNAPTYHDWQQYVAPGMGT
jgi:hypothetical protein